MPFQLLSFLRVAQVQEMKLPVQISPNTPFVNPTGVEEKVAKKIIIMWI